MMHAIHAEPRTHFMLSRCAFQSPWARPTIHRTRALIAVPVTMVSRMIVTKKPVLSRRKLNIVRLAPRCGDPSPSDGHASEGGHDLIGDRPHQLVHVHAPADRAIPRR